MLPFTNLSGDPTQDYFADGITENLTTDLSRIRDSFVIARNTAFTYKGKSVDAKEIGKELGVRYVLEGSVQRDQNRVRINAQLIDAESGAHLWADRFEENVADLFKLEDEVVARLARSLELALGKAEAEKGGRSENPDVIDLTMRGSGLIIRGVDRESNREARAFFERALQIDANDAKALAGSAETYMIDHFNGWGDPGTDYEAKVLGQANRATSLAPKDPYVYYPKANFLALSGRPREALGAADAGLAVNPNYVLLYVPRAIANNSLGRFEQAKADVGAGDALEPARRSNRRFSRHSGRRGARPWPFRPGGRRISQGDRPGPTAGVFCPHEPGGRLRAGGQNGRGQGRAGRSSPPESGNHGQMDERAYAKSSGRVRRPA